MKFPGPSSLVAVALGAVLLVSGQTAVAQSARAAVPTTRILAIGNLKPGVSIDQVRAVMPSEVRETVALYLAGKIDQWFVQQGPSGVVFILNETDPVQAKAELEALPLGKAGLMEFRLIALGPLSPLQYLLDPPAHP